MVPLAAVVYLGQSSENVIRRLEGGQAFCRLWEGCSVANWAKEDAEKATETAMKILKKVPVYHLMCRPDESAVGILEKELVKEW